MVKAKEAAGKMWQNVIAVIAAVLVGGGAFAVWILYFRALPIESAASNKRVHRLTDNPHIVFLPFDNMNSDLDQKDFTDGVRRRLIGCFQKHPDCLLSLATHR
jgi:hypothetical protein